MSFLAIDFGAGSGRAIVGSLRDGIPALDEIHRFPNPPVQRAGHLYWNFPVLFNELKTGLKAALAKYPDLQSIGVDTWGVDFGLLNAEGSLIGLPHCYRDERTKGILPKAFALMPEAAMYAECGNQFLEINTAFQLLSMVQQADVRLKEAAHLLFMPDLFNYFLTGRVVNEYTIASTSNLLNARSRSWSQEIFDRLGLPLHLMNDIVPAGTVIGTLSPAICKELGCRPLKVVATASHDTASAVAAVQGHSLQRAYISSGTWSLMGLSVAEPILTPAACSAQFTNEGGTGNTIRFLRNITGLWILQSVIREWQAEGYPLNYGELLDEARRAPAHPALLDVDDARFTNPRDMRQAIGDYCRSTGQAAPFSKGDYVRLILESLAGKYREVQQQLQTITGTALTDLQITGGGSQNDLLNQLTANACGVRVIAGPTEATAIGNIMTQALSCGAISDTHQYNDILTRFPGLRCFEPGASTH